MIKSRLISLVAACAFAVGLTAPAMPASAETVVRYSNWQLSWDHHHYDHHHVMLGTVLAFRPYRLTIQRRNGVVQKVDLRNGTVILPTGTTPAPGMRVALVGRYSNGTFVVRRLIVRQ